MNTVSITRLAIKNNAGTRAVLHEHDSWLLMEQRDVAYGVFDWVCIGIVNYEGFDWNAWLLDGVVEYKIKSSMSEEELRDIKEKFQKYTGVVKITN
jgi:hypothetical protein